MANSLTRNPIEIDTAFTSYKASVKSILGSLLTLQVKKIRMVGASVVGQQAICVDPQSGNQLAILTCGTAGVDVEESFDSNPMIWADFGVSFVPAGCKILVYTK